MYHTGRQKCASIGSMGLKFRDNTICKWRLSPKQRVYFCLGVAFVVLVMLSELYVTMNKCVMTDDLYSWYVTRPLSRFYRWTIKPFAEYFSTDSMPTYSAALRLLTDCQASPVNSENVTGKKQRMNLNSSKKIYFTVNSSKEDRLGNKMFQFAALIGLTLTARDRGFCAVPVIQDGNSLEELLEILHHIRPTKVQNLTNTRVLVEDKAMAHSSALLKNIKADENYTIGYYLQSWKYFEHYSSVIRKAFKFNENISQKANKCLQNIVEQFAHQPILVGVHVRNVFTENEVPRGYAKADAVYLNRALDFYRRKFSNVVFVLTSDDIDWAMENVRGHDIRYSVGISPEADMALLSMCNHSVITSGTFGWWAGWLTGGSVVYYKDFPRSDSWLDSKCSKEDYYPAHWIGMS